MHQMLKAWDGKRHGTPPWDKVDPQGFEAAFDEAIQLAERDIETIANDEAPPTFENTIVAFEQAGQELDRLETLFSVHVTSLNIGPIPDAERAVMPKLAAYADRVTQNEKLFKRIAAVNEGAMDDLDPAQRRLVEDRYKTFVRKGARLDNNSKSRLAEINKRLATLFADFSQNVMSDEQKYVTWIEREADLSGLPASTVAAMAAAAKERGKEGAWAVTDTRSSMDPFLTYSDSRALREQVWRTYYSRGDNGDEHDNKELITEIVKLRAERAKLLDYATHAHWRLEPQMAKTPEAASDLMMQVWDKAVARVGEEVRDMQTLADAEDAGITIRPWDYRYYAEKVRKQKYALDFNEVKPYLQLDKLREAMMWVAGELFGMQFREVDDVPVFHSDVQVWEVLDASQQQMGLFYFDPFAREGKRSGAWMSSYRQQQNIDRPITPIVSNNSNFVPPAEGQLALISWDDAETLFHEFGHALHGLCSRVKYPSQSGTAVARDFVEFPSQVYEHWLSTPEVLNRFAVHHDSGAALPAELLAKVERAATFNKGFDTVEFLASAIVDMRLHLVEDGAIKPGEFERTTLEEIGMPSEIVMRHRMPHFAHLFADDGYSAGYYSYLWADALTADAAEAFEEGGGYYDQELAGRLFDHVLSVGDTVDPAESYRRFRGRDVDTGALLRKRGFPDT